MAVPALCLFSLRAVQLFLSHADDLVWSLPWSYASPGVPSPLGGAFRTQPMVVLIPLAVLTEEQWWVPVFSLHSSTWVIILLLLLAVSVAAAVVAILAGDEVEVHLAVGKKSQPQEVGSLLLVAEVILVERVLRVDAVQMIVDEVGVVDAVVVVGDVVEVVVGVVGVVVDVVVAAVDVVVVVVDVVVGVADVVVVAVPVLLVVGSWILPARDGMVHRWDELSAGRFLVLLR